MTAGMGQQARLPRRYVNQGLHRLARRFCGNARSRAGRTVNVPFGFDEASKKPPCIAGLYLAGRDVAKDIFDAGGVPLTLDASGVEFAAPHDGALTQSGEGGRKGVLCG